MPDDLVPGRECGDCNVCCVALTIDDPALRKPQGIRCVNAQPDNGCAIYADRPRTCRDFYCGWRLLRWVKQPLRPDLSGVLIRLHGVVAPDGEPQLGIDVTLLTDAALRAEGLAETVAAAVGADRPVFLTIPGPPGYTSARARVDAALAGPVQARDKAAVLAVLRRGRRQGLKGPRAPILPRPPG